MHGEVPVCARRDVIQALHQVLRILIPMAGVLNLAIVMVRFSWSYGFVLGVGDLFELGKNLSILGAIS